MNRYLLVAALLVGGAAPAPGQAGAGNQTFEQAVFAPELVLKYAAEIGLTAEQRRSILDDLKRTQTRLVPLQVDMAEPSLELVGLLEQPQVNEAAVVAKTEQVLRIENEVKKIQIGLLVRIKNLLTRSQQDRLRALRDRESGRGGPGDAAGTDRIGEREARS